MQTKDILAKVIVLNWYILKQSKEKKKKLSVKIVHEDCKKYIKSFKKSKIIKWFKSIFNYIVMFPSLKWELQGNNEVGISRKLIYDLMDML